MGCKLLIDADACPVTQRAAMIAIRYGVQTIAFCDWTHRIVLPDVVVITVETGADSADYALLNRIVPGDVVVTADYALAALCLAKRAKVLDPNGHLYSDENITGLLTARHESHKLRRSGGRMRGPKPRTQQQNQRFETALDALLAQATQKE